MAIPQKYQRSANYRTQYISWHHGILNKYYICAYCGRIIPRVKMEVDHVIPVDFTRRSIFARFMLPDGVNSYRNMVSACHYCNHKKSNKGGLWIFRGIIGRYLQPVIWLALLSFIAVFFWRFATIGFSHAQARQLLTDCFRILWQYSETLIIAAARYISSAFQNILR